MADSESQSGLPRRQILITMACAMTGLFLAALDQTVVGTAMPRIIADLGGFDRYTWVTTAYLVASTITVPIVGRLSDIFGRKWFYLVGLIVFMIGSFAAGTATSMNQLIAFRAFQGMGGGVLMSLVFVIVGDLYSPSERGKIQGVIAAVFGMSSVLGPTLGGFITDTLSWNWIFYINLPISIPLIIAMTLFFPRIEPQPMDRTIDVLGVITLIATVVPLMLALSIAGDSGWTSPEVIVLLVVAAVAVAVFIFVEMRTPNPIMPLHIYTNPVLAVTILATFVTGFGMFGAIIFIPLFFQGVLGASATSSGSFLTPMMLGTVVGASISGQVISRFGSYRWPGLFGVSMMSIGLFLMSTTSETTTYPVAIAFIVMLGFGLGFTFPSFTIAAQNAVEHRFLGIATSTVQFYRTIGGALGLALLGSLMANRFRANLSDSLPLEVREAVNGDEIAELANNPAAMVNPDALSGIMANLGLSEGATSDMLVGLRTALASSLSSVFLATFFILTTAIVIVLFLRNDRPLRTETRRPPDRSHGQRLSGVFDWRINQTLCSGPSDAFGKSTANRAKRT